MKATKADHYTYRVIWSEEDQEHIALCSEFPSLSWLAMQDAFNLWKVRKQVKLGRVHPVKLEQHVYFAAG